jgi:DNA-binding response OmpR family regulator
MSQTILILDDSEVVLDVARKYLEDAGYTVLTASTIDRFEELHKSSSPDLILLDVQMPELFGDDIGLVLRTVRRVKARIVLFSTLDDDELEQRAREAQLDGFISKNSGFVALVSQVQKFLPP